MNIFLTNHQCKEHCFYWPTMNCFSWSSGRPKNDFKVSSVVKGLRKGDVDDKLKIVGCGVSNDPIVNYRSNKAIK